jgi:hypothetical protein
VDIEVETEAAIEVEHALEHGVMVHHAGDVMLLQIQGELYRMRCDHLQILVEAGEVVL